MDKRAEVTWEEFIKMIPAFLLFLLLVWAAVQIWNATHPEQFSIEKKDVIRLVNEIKDLNQGETIYVPVFSNEYTIDAISSAGKGISGCSKDYCICFVKDQKRICETFNLRKEFGLEKEQYKTVNLVVDPKTNTRAPIKLERTGLTYVKISN